MHDCTNIMQPSSFLHLTGSSWRSHDRSQAGLPSVWVIWKVSWAPIIPTHHFQGEGEELNEGRSFLGEFLGLILILCQWFTFLCVVKLEDWAGSYQNVYRKNVSSLLRPQGLVNCESLTGKWVLGSWLWVLWQSYIEGKKWAFKESRSLLSWSQLEFKLPLAGREPLWWQPEPGLWWWVIQVWVTAPELVH